MEFAVEGESSRFMDWLLNDACRENLFLFPYRSRPDTKGATS